MEIYLETKNIENIDSEMMRNANSNYLFCLINNKEFIVYTDIYLESLDVSN